MIQYELLPFFLFFLPDVWEAFLLKHLEKVVPLAWRYLESNEMIDGNVTAYAIIHSFQSKNVIFHGE